MKKNTFQMLLFKTSAATLESVISNKKHALKDEPKKWEENEILLISKNKTDCKKLEKQIQYIMELGSIDKLSEKEIKQYWPESKNNWRYLVSCNNVIKLQKPFNLTDVIGANSSSYAPSLKPKKVSASDEKKIIMHLKNIGAI